MRLREIQDKAVYELSALKDEVVKSLIGESKFDMQNMILEYDDLVELPNMSFVGYTFQGWYFDPQHRNKVDWVNMPDLTPDEEGNITVVLYGSYTENSYCIYFNANGGSGDMMPQWLKVSEYTALKKIRLFAAGIL